VESRCIKGDNIQTGTTADMSWTCDNSGNAVAEGATVRHGGAAGPEKKGNAMWGFSGGLGYWEFEVLGSGGFWLGVTTEEKFGPGYGMKGLFFGGPGNLSDGGSLVKGGWGPKVDQGDVVGMRLEQQGGNTTLAFSKNGKGLGTAFNIQGWEEGTFVPAVSLDKPGHAVSIRQGDVPSLESLNANDGPRDTIEGAWKMARDGVQDHVLEIAKEGSSWMAHCKVGNSMSCQLQGEGPEFTAGGVRSTKMMPPPHLEQLENEMSSLLSGITRLEMEGGKLKLTSGGHAVVFNPVSGCKGAAGKDQVNWMK